MSLTLNQETGNYVCPNCSQDVGNNYRKASRHMGTCGQKKSERKRKRNPEAHEIASINAFIQQQLEGMLSNPSLSSSTKKMFDLQALTATPQPPLDTAQALPAQAMAAQAVNAGTLSLGTQPLPDWWLGTTQAVAPGPAKSENSVVIFFLSVSRYRLN